MFQILLKKSLWLKKVKNAVSWICVISDLRRQGTFKDEELKKINQKEFWVEKIIKRKGDLLYAKWFLWHSWIDKKDSINELIFSRTEIFKKKCEC